MGAVEDETEGSAPPRGRLAEAAGAIVYNLIPVAGVLVWGWSPFVVIFLYWLENVASGGRTLLSMLAAGAQQGGLGAAIGMGAFFTFHFGMFCFVHGVFVLTMFGADTLRDVGAGMFDVARVAGHLIRSEFNLAIACAAILFWQAVEFALFIRRGGARTATLTALMQAPYPRMAVLHVTIIFGGFLLSLLDWPPIGVLALIGFKIAYDVAEALGWRPRLRRASRAG